MVAAEKYRRSDTSPTQPHPDCHDSIVERSTTIEQGFSASPDIPILICQRKPLDRTLGLLRRGTLLRNKGSMNSIGFTPTSLHREEQATLMALSAKGQHNVCDAGSWQGFRFLSAVDETTIPEPAVPVRRHQLNRPSSGHYCDRLQANALCMSMTTSEWSTRLRCEPYQYQRECHGRVKFLASMKARVALRRKL